MAVSDGGGSGGLCCGSEFSMSDHWGRLTRPSSIKVVSTGDVSRSAELVVEPLESGFALTLGNALRRVMMSSLGGFAVYGVEVEGVSHELTSLSGVREDVADLVLNLSMLRVKLLTSEAKILRLVAKGPGDVTAADIGESADYVILNKDLHICTLGKDVSLNVKIYVNSGKGYVPASEYRATSRSGGGVVSDIGSGFIATNALYSPVKRVAFRIESSRIGQFTDYDRLLLSVDTDGSISPDEAVAISARVLQDQLQSFIGFDETE
ncbi:MAG: DNA-directed RNA polymerase subunit alpha, partial [Anaplasma sp.]